MVVLPLEISNTKYLILHGDINFWFDNWMGDGALVASLDMRGDPYLKINSILANSGWNEHKLHNLVLAEFVNKLVESQV